MSVKVYENGSWVDKVPMIYKNGAWTNATSVKVYENGVWVEKLINYNNVTITVSSAGFAENASNYIRGSADSIIAQIGRSKTNSISLDVAFIPPSSTNHFGKLPVVTFDVYIKNSNIVNSSGEYGSINVMTGGKGYNYSTQTGGYAIMPTDAEIIQSSVRRTIGVTNSYDEDMNMGSLNFSVILSPVSTMTIPANSYIEITHMAVNGVPYGVNTTITP